MSFFQAFVYLLAAVISVPLAKRLGLGSVLGYLLAGIVIGPFGLRLVGSAHSDVMHIAEFGVVMMLFVIGLELRPAVLWKLRGPIFGLAGAQMLGTGRSSLSNLARSPLADGCRGWFHRCDVIGSNSFAVVKREGSDANGGWEIGLRGPVVSGHCGPPNPRLAPAASHLRADGSGQLCEERDK